jgi:hypothetical protein
LNGTYFGTSGTSGIDGTSGTGGVNIYSISTKTTSYTLLSSDQVILANPAATGMVVTLPTAVGITGKWYVIKNISTTAGRTVSLATTGGQLIDTATTQTIAIMAAGAGNPGTVYTVISNGTQWWILTQH